MTNIEKMNAEFCKGAKQLRYINKLEDGHIYFSNTDIPSPTKGSWLRSIKFDKENSYLFVLDIDSPNFNEEILEATKGLYKTIHNYLKIEPLMKASGSKGIQLIFKLNFNDRVTEQQATEQMCNLAYTLWRISVPNVRDTLKFDGVPGIDCAMFTKSRMLRSFCKHLGSDRFSVPVGIKDSFDDITKKMTLEMSTDEFVKFPEIDFNTDYIIYHYQKVKERQELFVTEEEMERIKKSTSGRFTADPVYGRMPQQLRALVRASHIEHDKKWPIIAYLRIFERMTPVDIVEWLLNHSGWEDLSNVKITMYQTKWTCNWCDTQSKQVMNDFNVNKIPLPKPVRNFMIDGWKRKTKGSSIKFIVMLWWKYIDEIVRPQLKASGRSLASRIAR